MGYKEDFKKKTGVAVSTARYQLMKKIVFELLTNAGKDSCFRCQEKLSLEDFSIEHIKPWGWEENPMNLFMDLQNISFSHIACNAGVTRQTVFAIESQKKRSRSKGEQVQCSRCLDIKNRTEFHKNKTTPTGCESLCKVCRKSYRSKDGI